ncbi:hypothetical protein [Massilia sp. erpn]|uniref:hypothetical protein n=1 Tax=Massilia sp. erpn TaxID=2738142 RepID=UPI0021062966|nr:hypothetical protein [Massilia sp. erpn]UTY60069.1 hypothetical protein HPQ68_24510 [Massilia sp. erpn]
MVTAQRPLAQCVHPLIAGIAQAIHQGPALCTSSRSCNNPALPTPLYSTWPLCLEFEINCNMSAAALPAQFVLNEEDMQKHIAVEISQLMREFSKKLNDSLLLVQDSGELDDFEKYREDVSKLMTIMYLDIMKPIHLCYPDLEPPGLS